MKIYKTILFLAVIGTVGVFGATAQGTGQAEKPAPIVRGIGGDIPDSQAFIKYASPSERYNLLVPEGWGMTGAGTNMKFADKYNGVRVQIVNFNGSLSIEKVKADLVPILNKDNRAVTIVDIANLTRKGGDSIMVNFESNSDINPVTNKQIRLEDKAYFFYDKGRVAILTVWAPYGADNVDQWNLISNSFRWL
jgi:hypothetical protein